MNFLGYCIFDEKSVVENFDLLMAKLSAEVQEDILKYKFWRDRQATLFGKLLLAKIMKDNFGLEKLPAIEIEQHGRPIFKSKMDFNISHSGQYVMCAVSDNARIGIDVEKHRTVDFPNFSKYFTPKEWSDIYAYKYPQDGFFDYWSMKESVIKADGRGVSILSKTERQSIDCVLADGDIYHIQQIELEKGYSSFMASSEAIASLTIQEIQTSEL